ncbi:hypothetical protein KP509_17G047000 [Ceratopteris richardii]|uniref:Poly [ADP-ribose] polymerase n=1 Tax=Ceratopteris richardii TaxID=49495 RepID=A0A8T2SZ25_CERRI|nr:hypothetical protein KP509_17G047000 [Ceratopteris richardii]KAH7373260.1 hypothetical protein KP509_17G047000 [Ceratopteris richardii]
MEVDALRPTICRKRKLNGTSDGWPCKHTKGGLGEHKAHIVELSTKPLRFLYINKGRWEAYNDEVSAAIQISFAAQKKSARFIVSGQYYVVDFSHMMQLNLQTGFLRSIAWVDSSGKLVAPARRLEGCSRHWLSLLQTISQRASVVHAEEKSATPQELFEYSRCDTSAGCPQRKDDCQSAQESCNEGFLELGNGVCLLKKDDSDYFFVKEKFISGLGSLSRYTSVMSIHRCVFERTTAQVRLETFRKQMQAVASSRGDANVRYAWHGTSKKGIQGIISHGFGKSGVPKHGAICGSGFYLAPEGNSLRSLINSDMDEQGTQYMLLCKVIMGGTDEIQLEGQQFSPSSEDYDTCVDITERPSQFTWTAHMNTHILPQFIVKFKLSEPWQGEYVYIRFSSSTCFHNKIFIDDCQ